MKTIKLFFLCAIAAILFNHTQAQEAIVQSGDLEFLKGQTSLNVEFVYEGMQVGEFTEEIYLKQKKAEFRKAAEGDKFLKKWVADRSTSYEPKFIDQLNKSLKRIDMVAEKNKTSAPYTIEVYTRKTEPGFYNGSNSSKRNTYVDLLVKFMDTDNREEILCTISAEKIVGTTDEQMQMTETSLKITNAYALSADKIGKLMVKILTKKEKNKDEDELEKPGKKEEKDSKDKKSKKDKDDDTDSDN